MRCTAVLLMVAVAAASAQQERSSHVVIQGRVLAADAGTPLARVRVSVFAGLQRIVPALTDDDGSFALEIPSNTRFTLTAAKAGYATATTSGSAKESATTVAVRLPRAAAISGRVVDDAGEPVVESRVVAYLLDGSGLDTRRPQASALTDDRGEYRIGGLPAGRYGLAAGSGSVFASFGPSRPQSIATARAALEQSLIVRTPSVVTPGLTGPGQTLTLRPGDEARAGDIVSRSELAALNAAASRARPSLAFSCVNQGVLQGRVVTTSGAAMAGAHIAVATRSDSTPDLSTWSGDGGRFEIGCLRPGEYALRVAAPVHRVERYGVTRGSQIVLSVSPDVVTTVPDVVVQRAGAVAGSVVDEHGDPMVAVTVQALRIRYTNGRQALVPAGRGNPTDDRGQFRIYDLPSGSYALLASPDGSVISDAQSEASPGKSGGTDLDYVPMFHPGTPAFEGATRIDVTTGRDVSGLDFVFAPARAATVSGIVLNAAGEPLVGSVLLAVSHRAGAIARDPLAARIAEDGTFAFSNIAPGEYVVHALGTPAFARSAEFGSDYVQVTAYATPRVVVRTTAGMAVWGRVRIEGPRASARAFTLTGLPADPDRAPFAGKGTPAVILDEGLFSFTGLLGPTRFALTDAPEGWYLKSVVVNGIEVADGVLEPPLASDIVTNAEIVIGTRGAGVDGRILGEDDRPAAGHVLVFSTDPRDWVHASRRVKLAAAGAGGRYRAAGLPAGDYYVAAVDSVDPDPSTAEWFNPDLLRILAASARRVALTESGQRSLTLRLISR
jgi:hypothetical protein